ncbi:MAG: glycosyltransferase family 4 protein, partial [Bacteroidia bacterium]
TQGIVADIKKRFPEKRIYWLPNGVDTNYYTPMPIDLNWRKENGFSEADILLLYAGIIGHAQGLEILLNAALQIQHPRIKFILLGEGPEKKRLMKMKEEQKLSNVFFLSAVPKSKMPVVVSSSDIAVIPLRKLDLFLGAIPSKIFESIAMQKPILLGVAGEAKELFIDEAQAGLAFEPENVADLIACIERIIKEPELIKTLGSNGRNYAIQKFERDQIASAFMAELNTQHQNP